MKFDVIETHQWDYKYPRSAESIQDIVRCIIDEDSKKRRTHTHSLFSAKELDEEINMFKKEIEDLDAQEVKNVTGLPQDPRERIKILEKLGSKINWETQFIQDLEHECNWQISCLYNFRCDNCFIQIFRKERI